MAQAAGTVMKSKRFREFDTALMRCVCANSAHLASHVKTEEKFGGELRMFLVTTEYLSRTGDEPPLKLKTVRDRVKELMEERWIMVKRNFTASGFAQEYGELEKFLNSIFEGFDDKQRTQVDAKSRQRRKNRRYGILGTIFGAMD